MQKCGECNLCCKLLDIDEVNSKHNEWCVHCVQKVGCMIYEKRPDECKNFNCAWSQMDYAGIEMRPDKCGALFEKFTDHLIVGVTGGLMTSLVSGQIDFFVRENISVMVLNHANKSKKFFFAEGHDKTFVEKQINDNSELHRRFN